MQQFMSDCFSEGANIFDAKNQVIVDQEPGAARAMRALAEGVEGRAGQPGGPHQDLVD